MRAGLLFFPLWRRPGLASPARGCFLGMLCLLMASHLAAQSPTANGTPQGTASAAAGPGQPYVLHVYQSLVQVPALVLTTTHEPYRGLTSQRFTVQLDGGPLFHPTDVHLEGEDPIAMAVLLDAGSGEQGDLLEHLPAALQHLPPTLFTAADRLSVFAFDCSLIRSGEDEPATVGTLGTDVQKVLSSPRLHENAEGSRCRQPLHLWDAVSLVVDQLNKRPGRRILVVLSDGQDHGSKNSEVGVTAFATGYATTVFGIEPAPAPRPVIGGGLPGRLLSETALNNEFGNLCGRTGGLLLGSTASSLSDDFARLVALVRGRYILEFSRPGNGTTGSHEMDVTTSDFGAIVRVGGVSVPVADKALLDDPTTVQSHSTNAPLLGQGKPAKKKKKQ